MLLAPLQRSRAVAQRVLPRRHRLGHRIQGIGKALQLDDAALALGARGPVAYLPPRGCVQEGFDGAPDKK